jgi:hypothetical protein
VGSYPLASGTVSPRFIAPRISYISRYSGGISLVSASGWRLAGALSRYATSSAAKDTLTGTGSLYWWVGTVTAVRPRSVSGVGSLACI